MSYHKMMEVNVVSMITFQYSPVSVMQMYCAAR